MAAGKSAFDFDEGMAKINTTAQLSQSILSKLGKDLRSIGVDYGADLYTIPDTFEAINSQLGDVSTSTEVLKQALKGSKAGFTDQVIVADALAKTLSSVGKENTNAQEVLDTFFQAKNVGAGEFKDFAQYMPGLIASGKALGVNFKETAGMFAYMTGKGQSAERSAVLMENAFSAMGKIDIRQNLQSEGINVFDEKGSIRSMTSIFKDLEARMKGMSNEDKSSFLARMGIVDKEARSAFQAYIKQMKPPGVKMAVVSRPADTLKIYYTVYIDPLVLNINGEMLSNTSVKPVESTITAFIQSLPFDGVFEVTKLTDAIQQTVGVRNPVFQSGEVKYGTLPYQSISDFYVPNAGYLAIDPAFPLSVTIQYVIA